MWTNDEIIKSSTWRELKAVEITLKGCVDFFKTKFVKLFTDNQNVERISEVIYRSIKCKRINTT
jgi:hypothetical protein